MKDNFFKSAVTLLFACVLSSTCLGALQMPKHGLLAHWLADGDTADALGHFDGIAVGDLTYSSGIFGESFEFDGNGSYVEIPKSYKLNIGKQLTIAFWMKFDPTNTTTYQGLVANDFYGIELAGGTVQAYVMSAGNGWAITSGGPDVTDAQWHHIVSTYDGAKLRLYVDGLAWGEPVIYSGNIISAPTNSFLCIG